MRRDGKTRGMGTSYGITTMLVLAFMGIFALILGSVTSYTFTQARYGRALFAQEQALQIAEAGLEYYRWFLAHNPNDLTNGTGESGPYTYTVSDPEGGGVGSALLTIAGNSTCGVVQSVDITSTGTSNANPTFSRTLFARHMRPSVAENAYILNSGTWFGSTNVGIGPYHSNGGIRMDGTNNSIVSSQQTTYLCDPSYGAECNPPVTKPGVWGSGPGSALWTFPAPQINFSNMTLNFATLQGYAQQSGIALNPTSVTVGNIQQGDSFSSVGGTNTRGFHLLFRSDGTVDVYRVTATNAANSIRSYNNVNGWQYTYPVIISESFVANVTPPSDCSVIFSQAKTWIEGTVNGKITLIVADTGSFAPDIILQNNIVYTNSNSGLLAVAEDSVHHGLTTPTDLSIQGIFVAQGGQYGRDHYIASSGFLPSQYYPYVVRNSLSVTGTIVSFQRGGVCWGGGGGTCSSGFQNRTNTYDRLLAFAPPAFTPSASTTYTFILWREE